MKKYILVTFCIIFTGVLTPFGDSSLPSDIYLSSASLLELGELQYTEGIVSFFYQSLRSAPSNIQHFDLDDMQNTPVMTLADILTMHATGSSIGAHERNGALHGVRGIMIDNNAKTLVMINGIQANLRTHFGYAPGMNSPLLGDFATVDIVNGPGAILHGSGAINGFINLTPKTGYSHPGAFLSMTRGFPDALKKTEYGWGETYGDNNDYYLYFGQFSSDGFTADKQWGRDSTWLPENVKAHGWTNKSYRASLNWNHGNFNLYSYYQELNQPANYAAQNLDSNKPGYEGNVDNIHSEMHQQSLVLCPKLTIDLTANNSLQLEVPIRLHDQSKKNAGLGRELLWDGEFLYRTTSIPDHSLAMGAGYGEMVFDEAKAFFGSEMDLNPGDAGIFEVVDSEWKNYYFLVEDLWQLRDDLTLLLGVRMDFIEAEFDDSFYNISADNGHLSPRIALVYDIDEKRTIKASYQQGFRQPDAAYFLWYMYFNEQMTDFGYPHAPALEEETLDSYEINYSQQLSAFSSFSGSIFYNKYNDLLRWYDYWNTPHPHHVWSDDQMYNVITNRDWWLGMFLNSPDTITTYGTELSLDYNLENTSLNASYSFTKIDGLDSERFPSHQVKLNSVHRRLNDRLALGLSYLYSRGLNAKDTPDAHPIYLSDRHLVEASCRFRITDYLTAQLIVKNIFRNEVPPVADKVDSPNKGNLGYDETRIYGTVHLNF
ncbi:MAG TPA: TonB-dependent receptor [Pontiella sp.]